MAWDRRARGGGGSSRDADGSRRPGAPRVLQGAPRVPNPVPTGDRPRGFLPLLVDGTEPRIPRGADGVPRHGPREGEGGPRDRCPRAPTRTRGAPRAAPRPPRAAPPARTVQGGDGLRPPRDRLPRRPVRPHPVREPAERDLPVLRGAPGARGDDVPRVGDGPGQQPARAGRRGGVPRRHDRPPAPQGGRLRDEHVRAPVQGRREDARGASRPRLLSPPRRARELRDRLGVGGPVVAVGAVMSLIAFGVSVFLALYVRGVGSRASANRAFFVLMFAFALWDFTEAITRALPGDTSEAILEPWIFATWMGVVLRAPAPPPPRVRVPRAARVAAPSLGPPCKLRPRLPRGGRPGRDGPRDRRGR